MLKVSMKMTLIILVFLSLYSCSGQRNIPKELKFSFDYLNQNWDSKEIANYKNNENSDSTTSLHHFGIGMYLRNNLLRNNPQSDSISEFFYSIGIYDYDDMSSIILSSYHRYLNDQDIDLESQVRKYQEYWKPIQECYENLEIKAFETYHKYEGGDTITIQIPVVDNVPLDYGCPNIEWNFDKSKDLEIIGIISDKYYNTEERYVYFDVIVISENYFDIDILMKDYKIGEVLRIDLETAWIIK